jgi:hypothetical protein
MRIMFQQGSNHLHSVNNAENIRIMEIKFRIFWNSTPYNLVDTTKCWKNSGFLRNIGTHLSNYTASHSRRRNFDTHGRPIVLKCHGKIMDENFRYLWFQKVGKEEKAHNFLSDSEHPKNLSL